MTIWPLSPPKRHMIFERSLTEMRQHKLCIRKHTGQKPITYDVEHAKRQ